jgi:thiamine-monophosphate kinase
MPDQVKIRGNDDLETEPSGGEFRLIERVAKGIKTRDNDLLVGVGDDAALLRVPGGKCCVVTTRTCLEGVHFRRDWADPYRIGWKAVAAALSDVAAMGASPTFTFGAVALPADTPVDFVGELYRGMRDVCARFGAVIAGGDAAVSPARAVINVTQMGQVKRRHAALRCGAVPGDVVLVTGALGAAAAGRALLEAEGPDGAGRVSAGAVAAQLAPEPRVAAARAAVRCGGGAAAVSAMIDVSGGLRSDLRKLCRASGVGASVREDALPVSADACGASCHLRTNVMRWVCDGGDDFELLMTVAPDRVRAVRDAVEATGTPITPIGEVTADPQVVIRGGEDDRVEPPVRREWDRPPGPTGDPDLERAGRREVGGGGRGDH